MSTAAEREGEVRKVYKDHNLHVLWGVTLMAVLRVSSVTPAFPRIVQELGVSSGQVGLLITVFTLPGILLTPVLGVLSDRHGRKRSWSPRSCSSVLRAAPAPWPGASSCCWSCASFRGWGPQPSGR